jgi:uncharacterized membrane protein
VYDRMVQQGTSTQRVGVANMQGLTLFRDTPNYHQAPQEEFDASTAAPPPGAPHLWLAALLVLVAALWIINQHYKFGPLNLAFIIVSTMAGFVLLKALAAKYYVPGLTPVILAA